MEDIATLSGMASVSAENFGGKIANLYKLHKTGFHVPQAISISKNVYLETIKNLNIEFDFKTEINRPKSLINKCMIIRDRIENQGFITSYYLDEIYEKLLKINSSVFAVRSSATLEDSQQNAFPGRFQSYLFVKKKDLTTFIKKCWASLWTPKVMTYVFQQRIDFSKLAMAVLIQEQIYSQWSGVIFTDSPTGGQKDLILIEAVQGLGPGLVEGKIHQTYKINYSKLKLDKPNIIAKPTTENYAVIPSGKSGILQLTNTPPKKIPINKINILAKTSHEIEKTFGMPQDIEWAIDHQGDVWILQSRPITIRGLEKFELSQILEVRNEKVKKLPLLAKNHDKVKIRLFAKEKDIRMGRGWLIFIIKRMLPELPMDLLQCEQISYVLIIPRLLMGETVRRFSSRKDRISVLKELVDFVSEIVDSFCIIAMEICPQEMTGSARRVSNNEFLIEFAYGSFIPKGVVQISSLKCDCTGNIIDCNYLHQENAIVVQNGIPKQIEVNRKPLLKASSLKEICGITRVVANIKPNAIVEFGIMPNNNIFLIDITEDKTTLPTAPRIISHGTIRGRIKRLDNNFYRKHALNAHFHTNRTVFSTKSDTKPIIFVVDNMFLSLEDLINNASSHQVGFIFKHGSLLNHLALLLRENEMTAILAKNPEQFEKFQDGDFYTINTTEDDESKYISKS